MADRELIGVLASRLGDTLARLVPAGIAVHLVDERYSTAEATRILAGTRHEKGDRDALAAALILQVWLDTQRQGKS